MKKLLLIALLALSGCEEMIVMSKVQVYRPYGSTCDSGFEASVVPSDDKSRIFVECRRVQSGK